MTDEEHRGTLDPGKSHQVAIVGKRGSGKTEIGWRLFETYPYDRVLVDPNGDIKVDPEDVVDLEPPLPSRWPGDRFRELHGERRQRQTLRFVPDFGEPSYLEDIDRAVGLAYGHGRTCCFVDEAHEAIPAGRTPPHNRRALRQGRHHDLTLVYATPRPLTVDPLMLSNADWVYVFKLPNPADRRRVADSIGWDPKAFDEAVHELGPYEYLRYNADEDDLAHLPALPPELVRHHKKAVR